MTSGGWLRVAGAAIAIFWAGLAGAQPGARPLCRDAPATGAVELDGVILVEWQDTVCLEHHDRAARMARLAERLGLAERPAVSEYLLDRRLLSSAFRGDVPLLRIVFPERSFFDTARSEIRPEALGALRLIAEALRGEVPDVAVFVAGHTDDRGGEDYNHNLSVARAQAVAAHLNAIGVGGVALWRVGFGEAAPLLPNDSDANMAVNRRVEFIIGARTEAVATWLSRQNSTFCAERADTARCLRAPRATREFEAVAITPRTGFAVGEISPSRRSARLASTRGARIEPEARQPRIVEPAQRRRVEIDAPARSRIAINLHVQRFSVPTLTPPGR